MNDDAAGVPAPVDPKDGAQDDPQDLCDSAELEERGQAHVFDLLEFGRPARGFVLRFDGRAVGYLNRCQHVPVEMDWQPGQFLDADREWILCSIHGAAYSPVDGRCAGGPCGRGRLTALQIEEREGRVYWYPSRDLKALRFDDAPAATGSGGEPQDHVD